MGLKNICSALSVASNEAETVTFVLKNANKKTSVVADLSSCHTLEAAAAAVPDRGGDVEIQSST